MIAINRLCSSIHCYSNVDRLKILSRQSYFLEILLPSVTILALFPGLPCFWFLSLHSVNTSKNKTLGRPGNEANFFVENLIATRKFDFSEFQGVNDSPCQ